MNIEWVHKQILNPVYINLKAPEETIKKILESESIFNIDIENGLTDLVGKYQNQLTTAIMKTVQYLNYNSYKGLSIGNYR